MAIVLTRIDDRLIHGQVMTAWAKVTNVERVIIVDDEVRKDLFMQQILEMAAPKGIKVNIYSVQEAINKLLDNENDVKTMVLAKGPKPILRIVENGVSIKELNIGGMGAKPGRKNLYKNISISDEEKEIFRKLLNLGIEIYIQIIPDDKKIMLDNIL